MDEIEKSGSIVVGGEFTRHEDVIKCSGATIP